jgi:hypothetical protein
MTYTVKITIKDYEFEIDAASQAQADQIAQSRCESYIEEMVRYPEDLDASHVSVEAKEQAP